MSKYYKCKCGNREVGDRIKQCDKCAKVYCSSCAYNSDAFHLFDVCPKCKHYGYETLGWIEEPVNKKFTKAAYHSSDSNYSSDSDYSSHSDSSPSNNNEVYSSEPNFRKGNTNLSIIISVFFLIISFIIFMDSYDYFEEGKVRFMKWLEYLSPSNVLTARILSIITMTATIVIIIRSWFKNK